MTRILSPAMTLILLSACSPDADTNNAEGKKAMRDTELTAPSDPPPTVAGPPSVAAAAIPVAMQGRWGLVAADCTSTRGDAKGLLLVEPTGLKFYESVAQLGQVMERGDSAIRANFAFSGEGMEWSREMVLELKDDGKTLVRRELGAEAATSPFSYARCHPLRDT